MTELPIWEQMQEHFLVIDIIYKPLDETRENTNMHW